MKIEMDQAEVTDAVRDYLRRKGIEANGINMRAAARGKTTVIVAEVLVADREEVEA